MYSIEKKHISTWREFSLGRVNVLNYDIVVSEFEL